MPLPRLCSAVDAAETSACAAAVPDSSPVALCDTHLSRAAEYVAEQSGEGVEDVLAAPCVFCASRLGVRYRSGMLCAACEWTVGEIPDGDLAPPRIDVVYYIRFGDRVKIGTSMNPRQRLSTLWHDEVLAFERGDRLLERARHRQFESVRLGRSEWFSASPELEAHIDTLRAGIADPWRLYLRWLSEATAARSALPHTT